MLDAFAAAGHERVDAATNYPINGQLTDHGRGLAILGRWFRSNGGAQPRILVKLGSVANDGRPDVRLDGDALTREASRLIDDFGSAISGFGIHWDNRRLGEAASTDDFLSTLEAMEDLHRRGFSVGFSGVQEPATYRSLAPHLASEWWIQVKENVLDHAARERYFPHFPQANYIAYGLNFGGVTSEREPAAGSSAALRKVRHTPELLAQIRSKYGDLGFAGHRDESLTALATRFAHANPALSGIVAGPSSLVQLHETLELWRRLSGVE